MDITELRLEDERAVDGVIDEIVALANAAMEVDSPWGHPWTPHALATIMRYGFDLEGGRHFMAQVDGELVGVGAVHTTEWDNHDFAFIEMQVHPRHRRQGIGAELLRYFESVAADMGRTKLGANAWDGSAGVVFAESHGYGARSREINRRQHLDEVSLDKIEALHAAARTAASSYELLHISGRTPDDLLPAVAEMSAAINDAPLDDLDIEDEVYTAERVRNYEIATELRGQRLYRVIARHRETGQLAGHTAVGVYIDRPWLGYQHDTSVVREHRGHRLGLLLKTAMNLWLAEAEPKLQTLDTWNAESNDHMISVNEELGYRWMGRQIQFQK